MNPLPLRFSTYRLWLALSSATLLILSFPSFNQTWAAWVALVPWFVVLQDLTPRRAFWWSYLIGLVFFLGSIWWLVHVTVVGWLVLCAYLALYFALFGWFVHREIRNTRYEIRLLIAIPSTSVALEYLRAHALSGFGWNLLGYSQTSWLPIIQIADVTGVWGVSFLLVMVNVVIARLVADRSPSRHRGSLIGVGLCLLGVLSYGQLRLQPLPATEPVKVAVVQGNIPQEQKWDEASKEFIWKQYERLTHEAATSQPDLIIWPETSVPGFLVADVTLTEQVRSLATSVQTPLLVGAPVVEPQRRKLFNSAALVNADGSIHHRYDKLHLVPFGEFIPDEAWLPQLRSLLPPIGDFLPGSDYTVFTIPSQKSEVSATKPGGSADHVGGRSQNTSAFRIPHSPLKFSVLICFEDIFPDLARRFVRQGAQWLVVITNDAWFGKTAAAYQHAQASTLRAVELRVPVIRSANTGWSGCIAATGRWIVSVRDAQGEELFVEGLAACDVAASEVSTLYERWGDWWAILCVLLVAGFAIIPPPAGRPMAGR